MIHKLSTKGMLLDLYSQRTRLLSIKDDLPEFKPLLEVLTEKDYYYDDDLSIPSLKELSVLLKISYDKARIQIKKLYKQISSYEFTNLYPFEISKTKVVFYLKGFRESKTFSIRNLCFIPKKGDNISMSYFKESTGTECFYVANIQHEFRNDTHEICIWLNNGFYNSYWQLRKDQAFETGELNFNDTLLDDYEIKSKIKVTPRNAW